MNRNIEHYLKGSFFTNDSTLKYEEISEGNINHIYRVCDAKTKKSLVLKQAEKESRISPEIRLSVSRGKREVEYFKVCRTITPGALPQVYDYNKEFHLIVMEDLSGRYEVLRAAMMGKKKHDFLGVQLAEYLARTTFATSDFSLSHQKKKRLQRTFCNPELCSLTERLVFTEPFLGAKENSVSESNAKFVEENVLLNRDLRLCAAKLKFRFMNEAQALLHGDFHFGSVFVGERDIAVFDPEFCFFGPIGFDLGNIFAHFLMEFFFHRIKEGKPKNDFAAWLKQMAEELIQSFETRFIEQAKQDSKDEMLQQPKFIRSFVSSVLVDTAGFAGVECLRRMIGIAKIPELEQLTGSERAAMERETIKAGVYLIEHVNGFQKAEDFRSFMAQL